MSKAKRELALVTDEIIRVATGGKDFLFGVKIWRGNGLPPVVLFLGQPDMPPPNWYTTHLAMLVLREHLGYSLPLPTWFHYWINHEERAEACKVTFTINGHKLRPWLSNPAYASTDAATVEQLFHLR
jgi:hypothetical protein